MSWLPWTPEQADALTATRDALLVANAGTGKTTTVVGKIAWLLGLDVGEDEKGERIPRCEDPCELREIAAITFTEKAAADLKAKLREKIQASERADTLRWQIDQASIGTIHSFCGSLLREYALRLEIDPTFQILDEREARTEQDAQLREAIMERLEGGDEAVAHLVETYGLESRGRASGAIDLARAALRDLRWYGDRYTDWCDDEGLSLPRLRHLIGADAWSDDDAARVQLCHALHRVASVAREKWDGHLERENVRDYDALILDTRRLLADARGADALDGLRARYRILIIDEFQDTDSAQRDIAFRIGGRAGAAGRDRDDDRAAGEQREVSGQPDRHPQLFLVGDPKQSIYRFRGADIGVWNEVERELEPVLRLTRNFRSDPRIIDFVNVAADAAMRQTGVALEKEDPRSRVQYARLAAAREASEHAGVEWFTPEFEGKENARRPVEAKLVARRILELRQRGTKRDGGRWSYGDMALLYRNRTGLEAYERELRRHGVPYYLAGQGGLTDRQEVADLVNALRAVHNRSDDLALFAYLRSPFVGVRDEVLASMRLLFRGRDLGREARNWLGAAEPRELIESVEVEAVRRGLDALERARALAYRVPLDELLRELMERTGYANHLLLFEDHGQVLANIETFLRLVEQHRDVPLDTFLAIWDRWDDADAGLPQEPLNSESDDVVTLMTLHSAKGLEWPIVFLIDTDCRFRNSVSHNYWSDPALGPALPPGSKERGPRDERLAERHRLQQEAEEARLLYVGMTRAMERLVVCGPEQGASGHGAWIEAGLKAMRLPPRREIGGVEAPAPAPLIALDWMNRVEATDAPRGVAVLSAPAPRALTSATEHMMKQRDPDAWAQRYVHGIQPMWRFARLDRRGERLPPDVRGTIVHGVLEEIEEEAELARILEETIGELGAPELEPMLAPGTQYRRELEAEILRVVRDAEWRWYTDGRHFRELGFLHLVEGGEARVGSFDLYRPAGASANAPDAAARADAAHSDWIVDFKTNSVDAKGAHSKAREYAIQAAVYRTAAEALRGPVRFRLHFTRPNVVVEMEQEDATVGAPERPAQGDLFG